MLAIRLVRYTFFFINATFIAFASFVVVKLLRFPMIHYANSKRRRFVVRVVSFFAVLVMIPAGITFIYALGENTFRKQANTYLDTHVLTLSYGDYLVSSATIQYNRKAESQLLINPLGLVQIDSTTVRVLEQELLAYDKLKDTELIIFSKD
jgi:nitrogen fixation/metabolism regulation signal transduction histidine kinase